MDAAQLFEDLVNFAGGDALEVHFGDGQFEGAFAAEAFFEGGRVEVDGAANLGIWNVIFPMRVLMVLGLKSLA